MIARLIMAGASLVFLVITVASPFAHTASQLIHFSGTRLGGWTTYEQALSTAGTGREQMAGGINQVLDLFKARHVTAFRLAPEVRTNNFIVQRIEEGAWPIPYDESASFYIGAGGKP